MIPNWFLTQLAISLDVDINCHWCYKSRQNFHAVDLLKVTTDEPQPAHIILYDRQKGESQYGGP
jgi:hypothetical protein